MKIENYFISWSYPKTKKTHQTICVIEVENTEIGIANAKCMKTDEYNKNLGRKLTLTRALKNANISKKDRTKIWDAYRNMTLTPRW